MNLRGLRVRYFFSLLRRGRRPLVGGCQLSRILHPYSLLKSKAVAGRAHLVRSLALASLASGFGCMTAARASNEPEQLASSLVRSSRPTLVLIHGLDSAKDTWASVQAELQKQQYPSLALDLRGHGESPLGNETSFNHEQLAADIRAAVIAHGVSRPFVLLGHSMGGMVVMNYAAMYPDDVAALMIEDMDIRARNPQNLDTKEMQRYRSFTRQQPDFETCKRALNSFGYENGRIDGWWATGRIFALPNGDVWSNINPLARNLAIQRILATKQAGLSFRSIAENHDFPVHLLVAGKGSVCAESSVAEMKSIMPRMQVEQYPSGYHSIHNTAMADFLAHVKDVVDKAAKETSAAALRKKD